MIAGFPLTLTLSLGEREQRLSVNRYSNVSRTTTDFQLSESQRTIPPLPKGEGRGEGETNVQ